MEDKGRSGGPDIDVLISKMSLNQLVGQMMQLDGRYDLDKNFTRMECGGFLKIMGSEVSHAIDLARKTNLKIPVLFGMDSVKGCGFWAGATIFPSELAMSCAWNGELLEEMGRVTGLESRFTGISMTFSPGCGVARELRWGRVNETFGEDPYLVSQLVPHLVKGYQGDLLSNDTTKILACAKAFAGYIRLKEDETLLNLISHSVCLQPISSLLFRLLLHRVLALLCVALRLLMAFLLLLITGCSMMYSKLSGPSLDLLLQIGMQ